MGSALLYRINTWEKLLLDFGKRNRFINFKETKRSNAKITTPSYGHLFVTTAREFGYKRTGENIVSALRFAYEQMLNTGKVKEIDGKVNVS